MQYRRFGQLDWQVSALGFGMMRLPTKKNEHGDERPDLDKTIEMVRYAIDHGVNYIDTAYPYHDGYSEPAVYEVLKDGYRAKVKVATKLPSWLVEKADDFDRYFDEQLERLRMDSVDFYLLHSLHDRSWNKLNDMHVLDWAERALADGRIGHLGFSFHDSYELFRKIVDAYDGWTFCQIQYNYMDIEHQAGTKGLQYATSKGLAVVVMEPIRGGRLATPPKPIQEIWDTAATKRTPAEWALRWVWNHPEVSVVLSGMSTLDQVHENVAVADSALPNTLTPKELDLVAQVRERYRELCPIPCTGCNYCMPCPNGVDIPLNFELYNEGLVYGQVENKRREYEHNVKEDQRASACIQCRECEDKCPQQIPISEWMPEVHEVLGEGKGYSCREL